MSAGVYIEFLEDAFHVAFHSPWRDAKHLCDLVSLISKADQGDHLFFTPCRENPSADGGYRHSDNE